MARADWTYEMPPFVADGRGIEAFSVETAGRTPGGTVATVLEHESEVYVAVDRSGILGREDLRAVPGSRSRRSTWTRLSSGLGMTEKALAESLEPDPDKRVEGGEGADARRRVELPPEIPRSVHPDEIGPRSRPLLLALVCLAVVSMFVLFAAYLVMEAIGLPLGLVALVVPGTLLAAVAVLAVRVLRDPDDHPDHASGDIVERPSPPGPGEAPERTVGT